jgi:hypothetical protein
MLADINDAKTALDSSAGQTVAIKRPTLDGKDTATVAIALGDGINRRMADAGVSERPVKAGPDRFRSCDRAVIVCGCFHDPVGVF